MNKLFLIPILFLFFLNNSFAANADLNTAFKNYQSGDFDSAEASITEALKSQPHDSYLIYNLGLTEYKRGKVGLALALWRRALSLNSQIPEAKMALNFAIGQMNTKPLAPHVDSSLDWVEKMITDHISINVIWPILLIIAILFFKQLFRYLALRKKSFLNDEPSPVVSASLITYGSGLIITILVAIVSVTDMLQTRATVIASDAPVKTGPSDENATLFDIPEGTELLLYDKQGAWYKIEDPTGRTGWMSEATLYVTSEKYL
jgi:tetratricopeptide (TPR) repeat protein